MSPKGRNASRDGFVNLNISLNSIASCRSLAPVGLALLFCLSLIRRSLSIVTAWNQQYNISQQKISTLNIFSSKKIQCGFTVHCYMKSLVPVLRFLHFVYQQYKIQLSSRFIGKKNTNECNNKKNALQLQLLTKLLVVAISDALLVAIIETSLKNLYIKITNANSQLKSQNANLFVITNSVLCRRRYAVNRLGWAGLGRAGLGWATRQLCQV